MKLALIGKNISHSQSPMLYKSILGDHVNYHLLDIASRNLLPSLEDLKRVYDAINITSPYKEDYFDGVVIRNDAVRRLGAINTILFNGNECLATNTDLLAVREILQKHLVQFGDIHLVLLGSGVMARIVLLVADEMHLPLTQFSRKDTGDLTSLNLSAFTKKQTIVINSCSRDFVFKGKLAPDQIFWDFNYHFPEHKNFISPLVRSYQDGQEMLRLQAEAAAKFWHDNKP